MFRLWGDFEERERKRERRERKRERRGGEREREKESRKVHHIIIAAAMGNALRERERALLRYVAA